MKFCIIFLYLIFCFQISSYAEGIKDAETKSEPLSRYWIDSGNIKFFGSKSFVENSYYFGTTTIGLSKKLSKNQSAFLSAGYRHLLKTEYVADTSIESFTNLVLGYNFYKSQVQSYKVNQSISWTLPTSERSRRDSLRSSFLYTINLGKEYSRFDLFLGSSLRLPLYAYETSSLMGTHYNTRLGMEMRGNIKIPIYKNLSFAGTYAYGSNYFHNNEWEPYNWGSVQVHYKYSKYFVTTGYSWSDRVYTNYEVLDLNKSSISIALGAELW